MSYKTNLSLDDQTPHAIIINNTYYRVLAEGPKISNPELLHLEPRQFYILSSKKIEHRLIITNKGTGFFYGYYYDDQGNDNGWCTEVEIERIVYKNASEGNVYSVAGNRPKEALN